MERHRERGKGPPSKKALKKEGDKSCLRKSGHEKGWV